MIGDESNGNGTKLFNQFIWVFIWHLHFANGLLHVCVWVSERERETEKKNDTGTLIREIGLLKPFYFLIDILMVEIFLKLNVLGYSYLLIDWAWRWRIPICTHIISMILKQQVAFHLFYSTNNHSNPFTS